MKISKAIETIINCYSGIGKDGNQISPESTRDQILYGNPNQDCTGIVITCFASIEVIQKAINENANLIICHEALFWNRGDETEWLSNNTTFQKKKTLLDEHNIVVWRNHDYIHSGIKINDTYVDGIFYGLIQHLQWQDMMISELEFEFNNVSLNTISSHLISKLGLNGLRIVGATDNNINKLKIAGHVMGNDNRFITEMDEENIDAYIVLELVDYTLSEYVRDSTQLGIPKSLISVGHFNLEEYGMAYMLEYMPSTITDTIHCSYVQSGDTFSYQLK